MPAAAASAPAPQPVAAFDIWEFVIEGNTVLPEAQIEAVLQAHLGPGKGMAAVEAARTALEAAYQKAGFLTVLVDIPEQNVSAGVVRLAVLEGRVGARHVLGARHFSPDQVREQTPAVAPGSVPDFNQLQAQLARLNRSEQRRVQPVLKPGRLPGTVDVELQVADALPLSGSVELNNQHSQGTTPLRLSATARYDNLWQRGHSLSLTAQTAPVHPEQTQVLVANYGLPTEDEQTWTFSLTLSNSEVASLGGTQVLGKGTTLGLRRALLLPRSEGATFFSAGADVKFLQERIVAGSDAISTPVRYIPWQLMASDAWSLGPATRMQGTATLVLAWRQLLARTVDCPLADGSSGPQDQFACKRKGGNGSFAALRWDVRLSHALGAWGELAGRLGGQLASGPLISAEQYSLGGAETVRGYYDGEASGDAGQLLSLEWRTPDLARRMGWTSWRELRPLLFVEAARATTMEPATGQPAEVRLASVGLGLRGVLPAWSLEGALDLGLPLRATSSTESRQPRLHGRVIWRF